MPAAPPAARPLLPAPPGAPAVAAELAPSGSRLPPEEAVAPPELCTPPLCPRGSLPAPPRPPISASASLRDTLPHAKSVMRPVQTRASREHEPLRYRKNAPSRTAMDDPLRRKATCVTFRESPLPIRFHVREKIPHGSFDSRRVCRHREDMRGIVRYSMSETPPGIRFSSHGRDSPALNAVSHRELQSQSPWLVHLVRCENDPAAPNCRSFLALASIASPRPRTIATGARRGRARFGTQRRLQRRWGWRRQPVAGRLGSEHVGRQRGDVGWFRRRSGGRARDRRRARKRRIDERRQEQRWERRFEQRRQRIDG
jgi:hypothetical protein